MSNEQTVTTIELSLSGLNEAYARANEFTARVFGIDLTDTRNLGEMCNFVHDGIERRISYFIDPDAAFSQPSRRENLLGRRGTGSCPSYVILSYFTPEMTPMQRELFCLSFDEEGGEYLGAQLGESDHYRVCTAPSRSMCEVVNDSRDAAIAFAGSAATVVGGTSATTTALGVSAVQHSSGAYILSGGAGYIANTIGPVAGLVGVLTGTAALGVAAVSVVGVGGAIYLCWESPEDAE